MSKLLRYLMILSLVLYPAVQGVQGSERVTQADFQTQTVVAPSWIDRPLRWIRVAAALARSQVSESVKRRMSSAAYLKRYAVRGDPENPTEVNEFIARRLRENKVVAIAEPHGIWEEAVFIAQLLPALKRAGLTHVVLELSHSRQDVVDRYWHDGVEDGLLEALFPDGSPFDVSREVDILRAARNEGLHVICADTRPKPAPPDTDDAAAWAKYHASWDVPDQGHVDTFADLLRPDNPAKLFVYYGCVHLRARSDGPNPTMGRLLRDRTQGRAYVINQYHSDADFPPEEEYELYIKSLKQAGLGRQTVITPIADTPLSNRSVDNRYEYGKDYDALLYHPRRQKQPRIIRERVLDRARLAGQA